MRTIVVFSLALVVTAQMYGGNGGSAYTMYGIGDLRYYPSARSAGMGYTGFGLVSVNSINTMSPASWAGIKLVHIEANALYEGVNSAETGKALYQARGLFNGATLAFPVSPAHGIVVVGGFSPYSFIRYNTLAEHSQNGIDYNINEIGTGGLTKAQLGLSYAPLQDLSFGVALNYLFGKFTVERTFQPVSAGVSGGSLFVDQQNRTVNFSFGGLYQGFGKISEALQPLSVGITLTTQSTLTSDVSNRLQFAAEADTFTAGQNRTTLPLAIGIGAAYQLSDRWVFAADYYAQAWGDATINGQPLLNIRNTNRFGVGAEKQPLKNAEKWLDKLAYRLGLSYNQTYYDVYGEPINEWAVTGGVAFPVTGTTRLNIGIEYAQRGTKTQVVQPVLGLTNLVRDNIIRVSFSLSIAEPWFVRYEEQ